MNNQLSKMIFQSSRHDKFGSVCPEIDFLRYFDVLLNDLGCSGVSLLCQFQVLGLLEGPSSSLDHVVHCLERSNQYPIIQSHKGNLHSRRISLALTFGILVERDFLGLIPDTVESGNLIEVERLLLEEARRKYPSMIISGGDTGKTSANSSNLAIISQTEAIKTKRALSA